MCDEWLFSCFNTLTSRVLTKSYFKLDILKVSEQPHKKSRKYCVIYNKAMQYTILNIGCLNCIKPVPLVNRKQMTRANFKCEFLPSKNFFFDIELFKLILWKFLSSKHAQVRSDRRRLG